MVQIGVKIGEKSNNEEVESAKKDEHLVSFDQFPMAVQRRLEYVRTKKYWVIPVTFGCVMFVMICAQMTVAMGVDTTGRILKWNYTLNNGTSLDEKKVYAHNGRIVDKAAQLFTYTMITSDVPSPTPGLRYIISFGFIVIILMFNGWFYSASVLWASMLRAQHHRQNASPPTPQQIRAFANNERCMFYMGRILHLLGILMTLHVLMALLFDCINGTAGIQLYLSAVNASEYASIEYTYSCNMTGNYYNLVSSTPDFLDCATSMFYMVASVALLAGVLICVSTIYFGTLIVQNIRERPLLLKVLPV